MIKKDNCKISLPEGKFGDGYCKNCRFAEWDQSEKGYYCTYHKKWVDRNEWHACCE